MTITDNDRCADLARVRRGSDAVHRLGGAWLFADSIPAHGAERAPWVVTYDRERRLKSVHRSGPTAHLMRPDMHLAAVAVDATAPAIGDGVRRVLAVGAALVGVAGTTDPRTRGRRSRRSIATRSDWRRCRRPGRAGLSDATADTTSAKDEAQTTTARDALRLGEGNCGLHDVPFVGAASQLVGPLRFLEQLFPEVDVSVRREWQT